MKKTLTRLFSVVISVVLVFALAMPAFATPIGSTGCSYTLTTTSNSATATITTITNYASSLSIEATFNFVHTRTGARAIIKTSGIGTSGAQTMSATVNQTMAEQDLDTPLTNYSFVNMTGARVWGWVKMTTPPFTRTDF